MRKNRAARYEAGALQHFPNPSTSIFMRNVSVSVTRRNAAVVMSFCRRSYYKEQWMVGVAVKDRVDHGRKTSRNGQASMSMSSLLRIAHDIGSLWAVTTAELSVRVPTNRGPRYNSIDNYLDVHAPTMLGRHGYRLVSFNYLHLHPVKI